MGLRALAVCLLVACAGSEAVRAQSLTPGPPGPFVVDVRGAMSGLPRGPEFYPDAEDGAIVPARGFGVGVGGHVYFATLGPARVGAGVDVAFVRGTAPDAVASATIVAPQVSFNFGTSNGWSHLSLGAGPARLTTDPGVAVSVTAINLGGGARWFLRDHLGIGFDVRVLLLGSGDATPSSTTFMIGVGFSMK